MSDQEDLHNAMHMSTAHHLELLGRFERGLSLKEIISATVKPGDLVVDAGCGTGLLSLWAAAAGAERVVAIDTDVSMAQMLAQENGLSDRITFVQENLEGFRLPSGERCDVLLGMLYFNDPRRDYGQTRMSYGLRERLLKGGGVQIPGRIEYSVCPLDWPSQDLHTRFVNLDVKVALIESRYGVSLRSLLSRSKEFPDRTWFPRRLSSGLLDRPDARILTDKVSLFCEVDYSCSPGKYPGQVSCDFAFPGICNALLFTQSLYFEDRMIFSNESLSWVLNPHSVMPGQEATFYFDESWLVTSFTTMSKPV